MLIYSKVINGVRKLFGTIENAPKEADKELVYKDVDGDEIELVENDVYFDLSKNGIQEIKRLSDGKPLIVYIEKENGELVKVLGKDPEEKEVVKITIKAQASIKEFVVGDTFSREGLKINKVYADGDKVEAEAGEISADLDNHIFVEEDIDDAKVVTVSCAEKTVTYKIKVAASQE